MIVSLVGLRPLKCKPVVYKTKKYCVKKNFNISKMHPLPKVAPRILRRVPGSVSIVPPPNVKPMPSNPTQSHTKQSQPSTPHSLFAHTTPQPPLPPMPTNIITNRPIAVSKPPLQHSIVVHASSQNPPLPHQILPQMPPQIFNQPPPPQKPESTNESTPSTSLRPTSQMTQPPSQLQIMLQMAMEEIRTQFRGLEVKMDAKIQSCTREVVGEAIIDLKRQFQTSEIVGETLSDNIPVFARPDSKTTVEHHIKTKGTKIRLFHPILSNSFGYWMSTTYVLGNGSVAMGYVLVFGVKLDSVQYGLSESELKERVKSWNGLLDQLSDKDFVPHVGRFVSAV